MDGCSSSVACVYRRKGQKEEKLGSFLTLIGNNFIGVGWKKSQ